MYFTKDQILTFIKDLSLDKNKRVYDEAFKKAKQALDTDQEAVEIHWWIDVEPKVEEIIPGVEFSLEKKLVKESEAHLAAKFFVKVTDSIYSDDRYALDLYLAKKKNISFNEWIDYKYEHFKTTCNLKDDSKKEQFINNLTNGPNITI